MADEATVAQPAPAEAPADQNDPNLLHVKVWSPFKVFYDGTAKSLSGVNGTGTFDILPKHHNFITILNACDLMLDTKDGNIKIRITGGVMHVRHNAVTIFLEV